MIKNRIKLVIDIVMFILMICLMNTNFTGMQLHEVLGIGIFVIFAIHKILNFKWIKSIGSNLLNKQVKRRNKFLFILDIILFLLVMGVIITGICISRYVFSNLYIGNYGTIRKIHKFLSWWSLILMAIHIGFHLKQMVLYIKNRFKIFKEKKIISILIIAIYIIVSILGIISLIQKDIYKNFIPNFDTFQYGKEKNIEVRDTEDKENNRKFKNNRNQGKNIKNINKEKEEHINKANIFDTINIMILFVGGTYYIFDIIDKKLTSKT